jgi:GNAT superfamily N-acetyltransferase
LPCANELAGVERVREGLTLRQAEAGDAEAIGALTRQAYAKWVPIIGREPGPMLADYAEAVRKHRIDLLYLDDDLVALIETIASADQFLIKNVAVSPPFQGRGLGRKLLAHAEELAATLGYDRIRLYTNEAFVEDVQLYSRLGYKADREEAFKGGIILHMSKPIACEPSA